MKTLKKLLLGFVLLIVVLLIAALFVKKDFSIEREIVINKPKAEVFDYLRLLKNQDHYSKWVMTDPHMKKSYRGTDGTVGFVYAWDGNEDAGQGEQEIKRITPGDKIDIEVRFKKPMESIASTPFTTTFISEHETRVTWGMKGTSAYPFNLMNPVIDGMLGKDLETSLTTLKGVLENQPLTSN